MALPHTLGIGLEGEHRVDDGLEVLLERLLLLGIGDYVELLVFDALLEPLGEIDGVHARLVDGAERVDGQVVHQVSGVGQMRRPRVGGVVDVGVDAGRAEHRDADAVLAQGQSVALHEVDDGGLGRGIGAGEGAAEEAAHGGRCGDVAALARLDHAGHEGDHAVDHSTQADAHDPVVVLIRGRFGRAERVDARGVEEQLWRAAEHLFDLVGGGGIGRAVGDVELDGVGGGVLGAEVLHGLVEGLLAHIGDHDFTTGFGEHLCLAETRARSSTCDEEDLVLEVFHPCLRGIAVRCLRAVTPRCTEAYHGANGPAERSLTRSGSGATFLSGRWTTRATSS